MTSTCSAARNQFLEDYRRIRAAEGRGSADAAYYRALPFEDLTGNNSGQWGIRAATFRYFSRRILPRVQQGRPGRPPQAGGLVSILDLGAGNCWLSYRLKEMGYSPVAVDIFDDAADGLRAARHYPVAFPVTEADFNDLPFADAAFDLVVYNASIHYSPDYSRTLREARRCLRPGGRVVILDSPVYARREHGELMRAERQAIFEKQYGFRSEALKSIEFFDEAMLGELSRELGIRWRIHKPWYGIAWHLRPVRAWWKNQRPPSRFWILEGTFER
jgi:SAM-dependent methyltransferase